METIDPRIIEVALSKVSGTDFENFSQGFFTSTMGIDYIPMGGFHDGGADGSIDHQLYEVSGTQKFMQASITADSKRKIRQTIRRLREFGRSPTSLLYATSQKLANIDKIQDDLSDELDCRIIIRDGHFFQHQINGTPGAIQSYKSYLAGAISYLDGFGTAETIHNTTRLPSKSLSVFLGQELDRRRGKSELLEAVADSLILWSLENTDPDQNKFLNIQQIQHLVLEALPSAKTYFKGILEHRLKELSSKGVEGRKVNFHKKENGYCLPYSTRKRIRDENVEDELIQLMVSDVFRCRASKYLPLGNDNSSLINRSIQICHDVIHNSFHAQGLEMTLFLEQEEWSDNDLPSINDILDKILLEQGLNGDEAGKIAQLCMSILRETFYKSTDIERKYLRKLSRTYILLFMLKNEPRIVEYFRNMTSNFNLYIGSDLIVRVISEHMLPTEDQMTKNSLKLLHAAGSGLVLTDKTLDEVWHHIKSTHFLFQNNYQEIQSFMTVELAMQIDKILIRAFFYAKIENAQKKKTPFSWSNYLGQFLTVSDISKESAREELRAYLIKEFGFTFEDEDTLMSGIDEEELSQLAHKIQQSRNNFLRDETGEEILSKNAAMMVLRIYQRRKIDGERNAENPYGFKTWWLTQQTRIQHATGDLVATNGSRYMMRPEFILHFLATIPSAKSVQNSYNKIFPSVLGVKLGNRMEDSTFNQIISNAREVYDAIDESRAEVLLSNASAKLQSDFLKRYEDKTFFGGV